MENRELIDQIYYLREKADNNKLAVFVGAGVSCNVQGMPSWAELVAKMAKEVGYGEVKDKYKQVAMTSFNTDEQVAFLHNSEILDALYKTNNFDSRRVVSFINNISSEKERNFYQAYLDSYNGDTQKRMKMNDYLSKLKEDIFDKNKIKFGSTLSELYKIKNIAMTQYTFYFTNSLFLPGFQDPKIFMKPYIEAIICANSEKIREIKKFAEISIVGEKYNIQMEDIDIISKFTSP